MDRERIVRLIQQETYLQPEIRERIRQALRNEGYLNAVVDEPRFSFPMEAEGKGAAHVTVKVEQGAQYRLGDIHIQKATVFSQTGCEVSFHCEAVNSSIQVNSAKA